MNHLLAQIRTRSAPAAVFAACAAVFFSPPVFGSGADLPPSLTLNVPIAPNLATPAWLGHPDSPTGALATLELPITAPDPGASLLVTVYFREKADGFMRVLWKNSQGAAVLADNFYENIGMANQRSLLIPPSTLGTDGTLILQGAVADLGVERIKLEWLESREDLAAPQVQDLLVTSSTGNTVSARSINGQPPVQQAGAWDNDLVTIPVSTEPVRIEQGVDFSVDLDKVPTTARVGLKESGLPLGEHLVVWVNEKRAGTITPSVPGLDDSGLFTDTDGATKYVGWRDGAIFLPVNLLKGGVNSLQFSSEDDATDLAPADAPAAAATPLAVKGLELQLNYQPRPLPAAPDLPVLHLSATAIPVPVGDSTTSTPNPISASP